MRLHGKHINESINEHNSMFTCRQSGGIYAARIGIQVFRRIFHELSVLDHSVVCAHAQESCMQFFIVKSVSH